MAVHDKERFLSDQIKLAVFDCDGTLVDSQHAVTSCIGHAFEHHGLDAPGIADVRRVIGLPLNMAIHVLLDGRDVCNDTLTDTCAQAFDDMRKSGPMVEPLYANTKQTLARLADSGWLLGVATGKAFRGLTSTLSQHGLDDTFITLQTSDKARGKPHPEMLHNAMNDAGAEPENTVMIGDTTFDIEMARAANVRAVGVSWGYHAPEELYDAGAAVVVDTAHELAEAIENT